MSSGEISRALLFLFCYYLSVYTAVILYRMYLLNEKLDEKIKPPTPL